MSSKLSARNRNARRKPYRFNMILPFWNSELYVEISSWFPFGKDYYPVSLNRFYDETLKRISSACLDLGSEFFFMASPAIGCVGNLPRENFFKYSPDSAFNLGFLMTLGYSDLIEKIVIASLALTGAAKDLSAGITQCSLWSRGIFEGSTRVIVIASYEPFFDGSDYLKAFAEMLEDMKTHLGSNSYSYYAERFGYDRFFMEWEKDNPIDIRISRLLSEFEFEQTHDIVGGTSSQDFPPFMGASVSIQEIITPEE